MHKLVLQGLCKSFRSQPNALVDLDFQTEGRGLLALIGANGSGKSTLLQMIGGLMAPSRGKIWLDETELKVPRVKEFRRKIVYISQDPALDPEMTGYEMLLLFGHLYGLTKEDQKVQFENLSDVLDLHAFLLKPISQLSGGQRQRIHLALGLLAPAELILMDEPSQGLDPSLRDAFFSFIKRLSSSKLVIMASHDHVEAEQYCTSYALLSKGRLIKYGLAAELKNSESSLAHLFQDLSEEVRQRAGRKRRAGGGTGLGTRGHK